MDRDCGWVELLTIDDDAALGRGRLVVTEAPGGPPEGEEAVARPELANRGQLDPVEGTWTGRIDPLRLDADGVRAGDRYRIRFEENGEVLYVRLNGWEPIEEGYGQALVESTDGELPSVILELGGH